MRLPEPRRRVEVVKVVFAVGNVVVMNALNDRLVAVILRQIQVRSPPGVGWRRCAVSVQECVEIGLIERAVRADVVQRPCAAFHVVNVTVGQSAFVEKPAVLLLGYQIQSPEIAVELIGRGGLVHTVDDAELDVSRERRVHARQTEQFVADRLKHPLLAAVEIIALLNVRPEAQSPPQGLVFAAPVVARRKVVSAIEPEFPRVFAHGITPHATAHPVAHVVVHLAIVYQRAAPEVIVAAILVVGRPRIPPCRGEHRSSL